VSNSRLPSPRYSAIAFGTVVELMVFDLRSM
jgi:hypothetical protein